MTEKIEDTSQSKANEWNIRLGEVREFAKSNNKWPSTTSSDDYEKSLAQWWSRYKYYYNQKEKTGKAISMTDERVSAISSVINEFSNFERGGIWEDRYKKVRKQIKSTGKLWSYKTGDKEEEKTLRWWNQQKTFYRKFRKGTVIGGMTEGRANKVESLLEELGQKTEPDRTIELTSIEVTSESQETASTGDSQ